MNAAAVSLRSDDPTAGPALRDTVTAVLAGRGAAPMVTIDLDGDHLAPAFVAALVSQLRRIREVGGAIAVDVRNQRLRDAIRVHGLDRVFGTSSALRRPHAAVHPAAPAAFTRPATA